MSDAEDQRATGRVGLPTDPVFHFDGTDKWSWSPSQFGWYYWLETWADYNGPFETEELARADLERYAREELGVIVDGPTT